MEEQTPELRTGRPGVAEVRSFWEEHPLYSSECPFPPGTPEFFAWTDELRRGIEAFSEHLYEFDRHAGDRVLDVGCGVGWLCQRFAAGGAKVFGVDLTRQAIELTGRRLALQGLSCVLAQANAERLPFRNGSFDFVTCGGVLHHTPDIDGATDEIFRVLRPGGRALVSLYYRNWLLSGPIWPLTRLVVRRLARRVPGRAGFGRIRTVEELVRTYDGDDNPLGRCYGRSEVLGLFQDFIIEDLEVHYYPRRFIPLSSVVPGWVQRLLDRYCGLVIYVKLRRGP